MERDAYRKDSSPKPLNWEKGGAPVKKAKSPPSKDAPKVGKIKDVTFKC